MDRFFAHILLTRDNEMTSFWNWNWGLDLQLTFENGGFFFSYKQEANKG